MVRDISIIGPLNIDVIIIGDGPKSWDQISKWDGPADIEIAVAGSIGYTSQNLAKLGLRVKIYSVIPNGVIGSFILETLAAVGVDIGGIEQAPSAHFGVAAYMLVFSDRKRPLAYRLPSHLPWPASFDVTSTEDILNARAIMCGGYLHFREMWYGETTKLFKTAKQKHLLTILDPQFPLFNMQEPWLKGIQDLLPFIDVFLCDENEAIHITCNSNLKDAANTILDYGPGVVVIKQGPNGSSIFTKQYEFHQPAIKFARFVDSIGAGDAYDAAFVFGLLRGWSLERCALAASFVAGKTTTGTGGSSTMPNLLEIEEVVQALDVK